MEKLHLWTLLTTRSETCTTDCRVGENHITSGGSTNHKAACVTREGNQRTFLWNLLPSIWKCVADALLNANFPFAGVFPTVNHQKIPKSALGYPSRFRFTCPSGQWQKCQQKAKGMLLVALGGKSDIREAINLQLCVAVSCELQGKKPFIFTIESVLSDFCKHSYS